MQRNQVDPGLDDSVEQIFTENEYYLQEKLNEVKPNLAEIAMPFTTLTGGGGAAAAGVAAGGGTIAINHDNNTNTSVPAISERDDKHLKFIGLKVDENMNERKVEVVDGDTQTDWYIFESHSYYVCSWKYEASKSKVSRRFSDFEWFREELVLMYPGYFLPPLPEKGYYSKVDPKIEYFNAKKIEFMNYRLNLLTLFLRDLLAHRELKYAPLLELFLTATEQVEKTISFSSQKQQYISQRPKNEEAKEGLLKNIWSTGFSMFSKAVGTTKVERRVPDQHDENYRLLLEHYTKQYNKIKDLAQLIQLIVDSKKEQADNMTKVSVLISQIKNSDEGIKGNLDKIASRAGVAEIGQFDILHDKILVPMKSCIETINWRDSLAQSVFNLSKEVKVLEQQMRSDDETRELRLKLSMQEKKMGQFLVNFKQNEVYFEYHFNLKINTITKMFDDYKRSQNSELSRLWQQCE